MPAAYAELSDTRLVDAVATGDEGAIAELYARFRGIAFGRAYIVLHDAMTAEDVVQESFIKVWQAANTYDAERAGLTRWLMIIVQRRAIDQRRRKWARRETYLDAALDVPASALPMDAVERADSDEAVRHAVSLLPSTQREALELAWWDCLSHRQIAEQLDLPLGTVKTRIRLAMRKVGTLVAEG